jgi:hypothetical protein
MHAPSQPLMRSPLSRSQTPTAPSQSRRFFQVWLPVGLPFRADHSAYFGLAKFYLSQPFQPSTEANLESCSRIVNARFQCNRTVAMDQKPETQPIESLLLNEWEIKFFPFFHKSIHRSSKRGATARTVRRDQASTLTPEDTSGMVAPAHHTMLDLVAYIDGGSLGNPGPSGIGVVIDGPSEGTIRIANGSGTRITMSPSILLCWKHADEGTDKVVGLLIA